MNIPALSARDGRIRCHCRAGRRQRRETFQCERIGLFQNRFAWQCAKRRIIDGFFRFLRLWRQHFVVCQLSQFQNIWCWNDFEARRASTLIPLFGFFLQSLLLFACTFLSFFLPLGRHLKTLLTADVLVDHFDKFVTLHRTEQNHVLRGVHHWQTAQVFVFLNERNANYV